MNLLSITELITPEETHDQNKFTRLHNIGSAMIYISLLSLESVLTTANKSNQFMQTCISLSKIHIPGSPGQPEI